MPPPCRAPEAQCRGLCFPSATSVGPTAHSGATQRLASALLVRPPLEDEEVKRRAVPPTAGGRVGGLPGRLRGRGGSTLPLLQVGPRGAHTCIHIVGPPAGLAAASC